MHDFNSLKMLANRPARVQATWLGFAASSGQGRRWIRSQQQQQQQQQRQQQRPLPTTTENRDDTSAIDYLMADSIILSPDNSYTRHVTEYLILLPGCYQPQDENRLDRIVPRVSDNHYLRILEGLGPGSGLGSELVRREINTTVNTAVDGLMSATESPTLQQQEFLTNATTTYSSGNELKWLQTDLISRRLISQQIHERARLINVMITSKQDNTIWKKVDPNSLVSRIWLVCFNRQAKITPEAFSDWIQVGS